LDDWVLCRIYNKKGGLEKPEPAEDRKPVLSSSYAGHGSMVSSPPEQKPVLTGMMNTNGGGGVPAFPDYAAYYDRPSDSMPRLHADSSCSEQVLSGGGGEVQSQPKITEWERSFSTAADPVNPAAGGLGLGGDPLLQDILMYWGKPF
jgi:hypothetical protein